ncbi:MAG TPA: tRNA (adenosine(37)-N6)-threonylcarbamoyltransferase complex transferase subunit TsaD [Pirellulaceae bacterium]|nr:tRNA (adenosine(37)-N6)-threonylcarbamoyltransferase complex transferase subunit TsaD [Pirellulaceae bacterium]HMO90648.1 tRNA (adenosine(37)-N6)-threonylcarbamoyltransferase complex transferase subunit TsaD [Pirellulaceae bacterium]HMP67773.1 tRNA (adenosine(37)-N6)-threonylcarbamoyltransferase complex transferase subunit TsaD [Pirellulaceae bacterium]
MLILTIESTCDETAAAVVTGELEVLASVIATQEKLHEKFHGVVPEIASRAHVERILPVIHETILKAGITLQDLDAIAVATTPGLSGSLVVGLMAAKSLCLALDKPLISVNHLHAHIYACRISSGKNVFPCVGLVVSGGHTHLYLCHDPIHFELLGGTIDDAAGEAFDKVANMLGLPFPGGPALSKLASRGDPKRFKFPRSFINEEAIKFSFSGLKTAVRYELAGRGKVDFQSLQVDPQLKADIAASFQQAVVDCLVAKTFQAVDRSKLSTLCVGGGVAANRLLRDTLTAAAEERGLELHIAPIQLCTDNAVMGAIAVEQYKAGQFSDLDIDCSAGLVRMATE